MSLLTRLCPWLQPYIAPKFSEAASAWLTTRQGRRAVETLRTYREFLKPLTAYLGNMRLTDIGIVDVRTYQAARSNTVCASRINHEISVLKQVLGKRLWAAIAPDYERLPEKESEIGRALSRKELRKLLDAAGQEPRWHLVYLAAVIAANTTANRREVMSLRMRDVDVSREVLHVNAAKNRFRLRDIPLNPSALSAAKELLTRARELGCDLPEHYVFPYFDRETRQHDPTRHSPGLREHWRELTRFVGLKGLRYHDLRYTSITRMLEAGKPEAVVKSVSGHVETRTLYHYSKQRMDAKRSAVKVLDITTGRKAEGA